MFSFCVSSVSADTQEKVTLLITGQSHSSLYNCGCPRNPEGGVTRRATVIKNVKNAEKNVLVLESGGSFAGGQYDERTLGEQLDKKRTELYLESLVQMGYDAFLVSSAEFNFGEGFLKSAMAKYKFNYLSSNLKGSFQPYIIQKIGALKIAIIGLTDKGVQDKTKSVYVNPKESLLKTIKEVKDNKKADTVVVLSFLEEKESQEIVANIKDVDIWVAANNPFRPAGPSLPGAPVPNPPQGSNAGPNLPEPVSPPMDIKDVKVVTPAWQARQISRIDLVYEGNKLVSAKLQNIGLGQHIIDSQEINSFLPQCFSEKDCRKAGANSICKNGGTNKAQCEYTALPLEITIIKPDVCRTCNINDVLEKIKTISADVKTNYLNENDEQAKRLISELGIKTLPAYLISKAALQGEILDKIKRVARENNNYFILRPEISGVSYFLNRKKIPNRLDVFFDITTKDMPKILETLEKLKEKNKNIDIHLNFLAIEDQSSGVIAKGGQYELEEFLRCACINKYYSQETLMSYLRCRLADARSSWWDDCALKFKIDTTKIKYCAQGKEGKDLLRDFIKMTQELEVVFGPTFVINNQEILSSRGAPSVEELEKLFE